MKRNLLRFVLLSAMSFVTLSASALQGGTTPDKNYLCFTANTAESTVTLIKGSPTQVTIEYSTDGTTWNTLEPGTAITLAEIGSKVYMRNASSNITGFSSTNGQNYFTMTGSIAASGNVMSLIDQSCQTTTIPCACCFMGLFYCCESLTTAPELPATTLETMCYRLMFSNCTNLTAAPELPATDTAKLNCYQEMFSGCSKLNSIKVGFSTWASVKQSFSSVVAVTVDWFKQVASKGIFICPDDLDTTTRNASTIPSGWCINGYDLTVPAAGWASMYLPIDVTIPTGVEVYYASAVSGSVVTLSPITGTIPAGTGVIVQAAEGTVTFPYTSTAVTPITGNLFEGTSYDTTCEASENYVLNASKSSDTNVHFSIYTGTSLGAFKAYLPMSAVGGATGAIQFRFDDATAITTVETESSDDAIYNLAGQRVSDDYRGIVIRNGKKMFNL